MPKRRHFFAPISIALGLVNSLAFVHQVQKPNEAFKGD
jgi:hypothetical protein